MNNTCSRCQAPIVKDWDERTLTLAPMHRRCPTLFDRARDMEKLIYQRDQARAQLEALNEELLMQSTTNADE